MDSKKLDLDRRGILPGFAEGRYESAPAYDPSEFARTQFEDPLRRDNRVSIRIAAHDMNALYRMALTDGVPLQSLLAQIIHQYANGQLQQVEAIGGGPEPDLEPGTAVTQPGNKDVRAGRPDP